MRKKISAEIKAKVTIESIKGLKTINEIATIYQLHPNEVSQWKKQFLEGATSIFSDAKQQKAKSDEQQANNLYRKIGQLEVENKFLKKVGANQISLAERRAMVEKEHPKLSFVQQCILLSLCRSGLYYISKGRSHSNELEIKSEIDRTYTNMPYYGVERMTEYLRQKGYNINPNELDDILGICVFRLSTLDLRVLGAIKSIRYIPICCEV